MNRSKPLLAILIILAIGTYAYLHSPATPRSAPGLGTSEVSAAQSWGSRIAGGHAFAKHGGDFRVSSPAEMAAVIDRIIVAPSASRDLSRGRRAYWDDATGIVVICDPNTADGGTAFKPDRGRKYFEGLR